MCPFVLAMPREPSGLVRSRCALSISSSLMSSRLASTMVVPFSFMAMWRPSAVAQARHCRPYTGPSSPFASAHSFQMRTPFACSERTFVSPRRNQSSSSTTDFRWMLLVVTSGKPSVRSNRSCAPKTESVPVPVRSPLRAPWSRMCRRRSR